MDGLEVQFDAQTRRVGHLHEAVLVQRQFVVVQFDRQRLGLDGEFTQFGFFDPSIGL